jgi:hypothetical protein
MLAKRIYSTCLWPAFACLLLIFIFSCGSKEKYAGIYKAERSESPKQVEACIELKENGEGIWRVLDDEDSFSWYSKGNELRLNTKLGGVIVGKIKEDILEITLPGRRIMFFKKVD